MITTHIYYMQYIYGFMQISVYYTFSAPDILSLILFMYFCENQQLLSKSGLTAKTQSLRESGRLFSNKERIMKKVFGITLVAIPS